MRTPHPVRAFAAGARLVLGERATAHKSNKKTAIQELLATLVLEGCIVTIDAMGTQANTVRAIRDRGADYALAVKDNPPLRADSLRNLFTQFQVAPEHMPLLCLRSTRWPGQAGRPHVVCDH